MLPPSSSVPVMGTPELIAANFNQGPGAARTLLCWARVIRPPPVPLYRLCPMKSRHTAWCADLVWANWPTLWQVTFLLRPKVLRELLVHGKGRTGGAGQHRQGDNRSG